LNYLYGYFLAGAFVLVWALGLSRLTESSEDRKIRQTLYELDFSGPDRHKFSNRILKVAVPILGSSFVILTWPYCLYRGVRTKIQARNQSLENEEEKIFSVNVTDLVKCMSVGEIEEIERINDPMGAVPDVAFGFLNPIWEKFKAEFESGDEIWTYKATWKNDWQNEKRFGYAILRGEGVVDQLMTNWEYVEEDSSDLN
jgi:hypothetical protein